jgi:hypothetical protein
MDLTYHRCTKAANSHLIADHTPVAIMRRLGTKGGAS